ncbi:MAG: Smr/MutS family protein [Deltaproteobacteria bacterium]|nr:Smr/MutS family protein [Deltaproteobacteria bacterium]
MNSSQTTELPQERIKPKPAVEPDEDSIFLKAMSDVQPVTGKKNIIRKSGLNTSPSHPPNTDEIEVMSYLSDLVSGNAQMDITFSDEYIEGAVQGFSPNLMKRLRQGRFPIQNHIDLHGLTKQEAEAKIREFIIKSHSLGLRCVLLIHGRGLNSENHIPVLKERIPVWLNRGPVKKIVLAFSTARPYDGGTGAIYVLLRRRTGVI